MSDSGDNKAGPPSVWSVNLNGDPVVHSAMKGLTPLKTRARRQSTTDPSQKSPRATPGLAAMTVALSFTVVLSQVQSAGNDGGRDALIVLLAAVLVTAAGFRFSSPGQ
jgi:hypothetical protein